MKHSHQTGFHSNIQIDSGKGDCIIIVEGDSYIQIDSGKGDCIIITVGVNKEKKKKTKTIKIMTKYSLIFNV